MEPAMVACGGVAAVTLGWWLVARAGSLIGTPSRLVATAVLAAVGFMAIPRPSAAEPVPPIVRLADDRDEAIDGASAYVVERGDSLWCIAAGTLGRRRSSPAIARLWPRIYEANREIIGEDPDLILPGQRLTIPEP